MALILLILRAALASLLIPCLLVLSFTRSRSRRNGLLIGLFAGFVAGILEAALAAGADAQRAEVVYGQFGVFCPVFGGVIAHIVMNRREMARERRRAAGKCAACGYDLTGNVSGVCPECGTARPNGKADVTQAERDQAVE